MKKMKTVIITAVSCVGFFALCAGISFVQVKLTEKYGPKYETRYLNEADIRIRDRLGSQYRDIEAKYGQREQIIKLRDEYAKKKHPTEMDKLYIEAYDKFIDELTEELAENPTLEELSAEIDALGTTEPFPEDYEGTISWRMIEIK